MLVRKRTPGSEPILDVEQADYYPDGHRRRRRVWGIPLFFWFCCGCGVAVVAILAFAFGLTSYIESPSSRVAAPSPPTPPISCNYSSWTEFSFQCLELPNGTLAQLRSRFSTPASDDCPQLFESQECDPQQTTLVDTRITQQFFCHYDDPYTQACTSYDYRIFVRWYPTTNKSDLTAYYAEAPFLGFERFNFLPISPCSEDCPASSGLPLQPNCSYPSFGAWSSFCAENEGNFSVFRTAISNPFNVDCPDLVERQPCVVNSTGGTCSSQYTVVNATGTVGCSYNQSTCLCNAFAVTFDTYHWCSTNASNADLNLFYASTTPYVGSQIIQPGTGPCPSQCNPVNTTCYTQPSPSVASPSPSATPTPSSPCSYTAYGPPSLICYQNSSGDFHQILTRGVSPYSDACNDTVAYQPCNTTSCELWTDISVSYACQYQNGFCNGSIETQVNTHRCAILSSANYSAFIEQVPGTVFSTIVTTNLSCDASCPLTNFSGFPSPTPVPAADCVYSNWSSPSPSCIEFPAHTYVQFSSRYAITLYSYCTDVLLYQPCNVSNCTLNNITDVQITCNYDTLTTLCANSTTLTTITTLCSSNTSNVTNYLLSEPWPSISYYTRDIVPCLAQCPATNGTLPAPSPSPTPPACSYSAWSFFSFECYEYPTGVYFQLRTKTLLVDNPDCQHLVQKRSCQAPDCQFYNVSTSFTRCFYNSSGLCANTTYSAFEYGFCLTNASDLSLYQGLVTPWIESQFIQPDIEPCFDVCPSNAPAGSVVILFNSTNTTTTVVNLTQPLTECLPPYYFDGPDCVLCTNSTACNTAILNAVTGQCTQVSTCALQANSNPCYVSTCDPAVGICSTVPKAPSIFNASVQFVCDPNTGIVTQVPVTNATLTIVVNCTAPFGSIGSYSNASASCITVTPFVDNSSLPIVSKSCSAPNYTVPNGSNIVPNIVVDGYYVCQNVSEYCVNSTCIPIGRAHPEKCYYIAPIYYPLPPKFAYQICGTVFDARICIPTRYSPSVVALPGGGYIVYQVVYDDSRCLNTIGGDATVHCLPDNCPGSVTGCSQCGTLYLQQNVSTFFRTSAGSYGCTCCVNAHGNTDCIPGYVCFNDQCIFSP